VKRFRDRERHQIFLEPEGLETDEVYVNGISTSLPRDVQEKFVRSIAGLERAEFIRHGYAVEYDAIDPRQLKSTLESKDIQGLFFAGQVNGTSGYEEAAAQGLMAGINAAQRALGGAPQTLLRHEAYIGVLIDDLITKGADEPYRMFTSRAEHRLQLREDNADLRLSEIGHRLRILSDECFERFASKRDEIERRRTALSTQFVYPTEETNRRLSEWGESELRDRASAEELLRRPGIDWAALEKLGVTGGPLSSDEVREQIEVQIKYAGYIRREADLMEEVRKSEELRIPPEVVFDEVPGLSNEVKGRLKSFRPETVGQASRMQGITPAAIANLVIFMAMRRSQTGASRPGP
jgi:tRNA uridine 5-carboxymethylaminomethyl modification enzyme